MKSQCLISFGSNLGARRDVIADAAQKVARSGWAFNFRTSRLFQTPPIGGPGGQEPFLNAVAAFDTTASAREVLDLLHRIEQALGRKRDNRWGARSIDLDVVLHGDLVGGDSEMIVPHPRYPARRFVLQPACDVAAEYRDPRFGWTIGQLANHVMAGQPSIALAGGSLEVREHICRRLSEEHGLTSYLLKSTFRSINVVANVPHGVVERQASAELLSSKGLKNVEFQNVVTQEVGDSQQEGAVIELDHPRVPPKTRAPWVSSFLPDPPPGQATRDQATRDQATCNQAAREQSKVADEPSSENIGPRLAEPIVAPVLPNHSLPKLIARIERVTEATAWPAPHQIWPKGWRWPEYRLEVSDLDWAIGELASAIDSMACQCEPVTSDGDWW